MYMYVCMYVCTYIYIYIHIYVGPLTVRRGPYVYCQACHDLLFTTTTTINNNNKTTTSTANSTATATATTTTTTTTTNTNTNTPYVAPKGTNTTANLRTEILDVGGFDSGIF